MELLKVFSLSLYTENVRSLSLFENVAIRLICGNKMPTRCKRVFLLQILLLVQHVSGTTMPIIKSSRVLYSGWCLWYFVLWFSSCWSGVDPRVMFAGCCSILQTGQITLSSTPDQTSKPRKCPKHVDLYNRKKSG